MWLVPKMLFDHDYKNYPELSNKEIAEFGFSSPHKQITSDFRAKVVKVYDGDTVTLRADFRDFDFKLRLAGINSPEMNEGGEQARDWLKGMVLNRWVDIAVDPRNRVGKYGRLIGRIIYNGLDLSQEQIYLGLSKEFGKNKEGEIPNKNLFIGQEQWF